MADTHNTPLARRTRTAAENLHARLEHQMYANDIVAVPVTSYVTSALDDLQRTYSVTAPEDIAFKAIATSKTVDDALNGLPAVKLEKVAYSPTVHLLNCISEAYYTHVFGAKADCPAIIFASRASAAPRGDYLAIDIAPDYYAYVGTFAELQMVCKKLAAPAAKPWSEMIQVGEHKRPQSSESADGQLKSYLSALKRYRVDLSTVHAFSVEKNQIRLASLNACGMTMSNPVTWSDVNSWIAHVALVYRAHSERDLDIQYCSEQHDFHRWDVRTDGGAGIAVNPFYVSHPPGRTTFACFEVPPLPAGDSRTDPTSLDAMSRRFTSGTVEGFWKMSWQTVSSRASEIDLLSDLHQNGWVPGLVRPHNMRRPAHANNQAVTESQGEAAAALSPDSQTDAVPLAHSQADAPPLADSQARKVVQHEGMPGGVGRVKEILHLGSIGEPLSQCRTTRQLVEAMYDLIEVHAHMAELGVLHRDVSWYNVMCNPEHFITTHPYLNEDTELSRPCISSILGRHNPKSSILLADLDHSVRITEDTLPAVGEKTGTPMFISAEIARPDRIFFQNQPLDDIKHLLSLAEQYVKPFDKALLNGKEGKFMADFDRVIQAEAERIAIAKKISFVRTGAPPPTDPRHDLRHDAESIFWLFLWAFARARPRSASPEADITDVLNEFCRVMFDHSIGGSYGEAGRAAWMLTFGKCAGLFHPMLTKFEELFISMAGYLAIPWYLYCGPGVTEPLVQPDHVHVAFRRFALAFLLDPANVEALEVELDTATPRFTTALNGMSRKNPVPTARRTATGATGTTSVASNAGTQGSASSGPLKRKTEDADPPAKKRMPSALATEGDDDSAWSDVEELSKPLLIWPGPQEPENEDAAQRTEDKPHLPEELVRKP